MIKKKSIMMRVPLDFKKEVQRISNKRGFKTNTDFLRAEGVTVLKNADYVTDIISGIFAKKNKKNDIQQTKKNKKNDIQQTKKNKKK